MTTSTSTVLPTIPMSKGGAQVTKRVRACVINKNDSEDNTAADSNGVAKVNFCTKNNNRTIDSNFGDHNNDRDGHCCNGYHDNQNGKSDEYDTHYNFYSQHMYGRKSKGSIIGVNRARAVSTVSWFLAVAIIWKIFTHSTIRTRLSFRRMSREQQTQQLYSMDRKATTSRTPILPENAAIQTSRISKSIYQNHFIPNDNRLENSYQNLEQSDGVISMSDGDAIHSLTVQRHYWDTANGLWNNNDKNDDHYVDDDLFYTSIETHAESDLPLEEDNTFIDDDGVHDVERNIDTESSNQIETDRDQTNNEHDVDDTTIETGGEKSHDNSSKIYKNVAENEQISKDISIFERTHAQKDTRSTTTAVTNTRTEKQDDVDTDRETENDFKQTSKQTLASSSIHKTSISRIDVSVGKEENEDAVLDTNGSVLKKSTKDNLKNFLTNDSTLRSPVTIVQQETITKETYKIPAINKLIVGDNDDKAKIVGDVSRILDFAILGHAKCATSFLMDWFNQHDEVQIWDYEVCYLYDHKPAKLVRKIYEDFLLPSGTNYMSENSKRKLVSSSVIKSTKVGFKCPGHFSRPSLRYFHDLFPNTVLIVGLRHPVKWFESYYNFRFRHGRGNYTLPEPHDLIVKGPDVCPPQAMGVCTNYAKFHQNLAKFGKSDWKSVEERKLLNLDERIKSMRTIHNPIFLYDTAQFYDVNQERKDRLKNDIQKFLGLSKPFDTIPDAEISSRTKYKAMDICDDKYSDLRVELVAIGKRASIWIRKFFITLPDVSVSTPSYFVEILKTWKYDPCTTNVTAMLSLRN